MAYRMPAHYTAYDVYMYARITTCIITESTSMYSYMYMYMYMYTLNMYICRYMYNVHV